VGDGTASATPAIQAANLDDMAHMGVEIVTTAEVTARLGVREPLHLSRSAVA
jgi:hypothetical protein